MWPNPQKTADLVTFTEEILTGKLHFSGQCFVVYEKGLPNGIISSFSQIVPRFLFSILNSRKLYFSEAVAQSCSVKKVFFESPQNS